jgi:3-hydroxyisobutyrate dehydrogenase-like beta-hydroxyacid dehydrogenase
MAVGFVGLGNMGSALAANLVAAGHDLVTHDIAGPAASPEGATFVDDLGELARRTTTVVLSLPDGRVSRAVTSALAATPGRAVSHVVDTSTIGPDASGEIAARLAEDGIGYVDAPVSGGVAGARARTLAVIYSGTPEACDAVRPVLEGLSDRRFPVGDRAGMAQALKLANNFLSATALAATSEAIAFGTSMGLDMATMLDVLDGSSGQSAAVSDKFANHVVTGTYASGFANTLMAKDLALYLAAVEGQGTAATVGTTTADTGSPPPIPPSTSPASTPSPPATPDVALARPPPP